MNLIRIGILDNLASLIDGNHLASMLLAAGWNTSIVSDHTEWDLLFSDLVHGHVDIVVTIVEELPESLSGVEPLGLFSSVDKPDLVGKDLACVLCTNALRLSTRKELRNLLKNEKLEGLSDFN